MEQLLWIVAQFDIKAVVDILLVSIIFFVVLKLIEGTQAVQLARGAVVLIVLVVILSNFLDLPALRWLFRQAAGALMVGIIVVFQPELRRALERLGRAGGLVDLRVREATASRVIAHVARACRQLAEQRHGALIILERSTGLQDFAETGVEMDSEVSADLLTTIFFPNTSLHDGAVIIREDRIVAAACVLPLTSMELADKHLGTRHRAAIGITEQTDALAVVVSEETGIISLAKNGRMVRRLDEARLRRLLQEEYRPLPERAIPTWLPTLWKKEARSEVGRQQSELRG
ncbi:MAG: TIGR00159 family protein [Chloroflexi bacterium]|nr:TIGR00159 family protein [Chloroflexota bacterium]